MQLRTLIVLVILACCLSGCGRRGSLEAPSAPETTVAPESVAETPSAPALGDLLPASGPEDPEVPPVRGPDRPFFLDFLL